MKLCYNIVYLEGDYMGTFILVSLIGLGWFVIKDTAFNHYIGNKLF